MPYSCFKISDEVQEEVQLSLLVHCGHKSLFFNCTCLNFSNLQVDLVRAQLRREMEKKGGLDVTVFIKIHDILAQIDNAAPQSEQPHQQPEQSQTEKFSNDHLELQNVVLLVSEISGLSNSDMKKITSELIEGLENVETLDSPKPDIVDSQSSDEIKSSSEEVKKPDSVAIPEDFRCPISLELMRDPVIVSTGQVRFHSITLFIGLALQNLSFELSCMICQLLTSCSQIL